MTTLSQDFTKASGGTLSTSGTWSTGVTLATAALNIAAISPPPDDIWFEVDITYPNSVPAGAVNIYGMASLAGTKFDGADNSLYSGSATTFTTPAGSVTDPLDFKPPVVMGVKQNKSGTITFSALQMFGATLPNYGALAMDNETGNTISTVTVTWQPIWFDNT